MCVYTPTYTQRQAGYCTTAINTRLSRSTPQTAGDIWGKGGRGAAHILHFLWEHRISRRGTDYQFRNILPQTNANSDATIIPLRI